MHMTLAIILGAAVVTPIDVTKPNYFPYADYAWVGDEVASVYVDHLRVTAIYPKRDVYEFHREWDQGRFGTRVDYREGSIVRKLTNLLNTGADWKAPVSRNDARAFLDGVRTVIVISNLKTNTRAVYYVSKCRYMREGGQKIQVASPELVRLYAGVWPTLAQCKQ
jgi:hypothetical protein